MFLSQRLTFCSMMTKNHTEPFFIKSLKHSKFIFLLMLDQDRAHEVMIRQENAFFFPNLETAVVLNSLLTGLFPIPFTSCCLEPTCLAASLRAWPQLRGRGLHGSLEAPDPFAATVHLRESVTDFYLLLRLEADSHPSTANASARHFLRFRSGCGS